MPQLARAAIAFLVFVATFYFVFWLPCSLLGLHALPAVAPVASFACAAFAAHRVWTWAGSAPDALFARMAAGALIVGGIGFVGGFFGPIVLAPTSNQGPLLGIFITGPLGALLGAIGGAVHWTLRNRAVTDANAAARAGTSRTPR